MLRLYRIGRESKGDKDEIVSAAIAFPRPHAGSGSNCGVACSICHTETDKSVFAFPNGGSIGRRIDGLASLNLNVGKLLATAANSRAFYPNLQLNLGGNTIGRAPSGLTENSTEAEVDAYLSNPVFYLRKPAFLHDASVRSLESLLDPTRGARAPHPFYVADAARRRDVIAYLHSRQTTPSRATP